MDQVMWANLNINVLSKTNLVCTQKFDCTIFDKNLKMKFLLSLCLLAFSIAATCQIAGPSIPKGLDKAVYTRVQQMPIYPGCDEPQYLERDRAKCTSYHMKEFINKHLVYPAMALQYQREGMCIVTFEIQQDGKIGNINLARDVGLGTGDEAIKVIEKFNSEGIVFTPGKENGEVKIVSYTLPIKFNLPR